MSKKSRRPPLGLAVPEKTQELSRLFDGAGQPHKSRRRVLAAVRTAERRPVKASLTVLIGEAVKKGGFDFIFVTEETPDTFSLLVFLHLRHLAHTHTQLDHLEVLKRQNKHQFLDLQHPSFPLKELLECREV